MNSIQIVPVKVEMILDLRHRILREGLPREAANFEGDHAPGTIHLAAMNAKELVGCATVLRNTFENRPACQLRGMAVDPAQQRSGVGKMLLEEVDRIAAGQKISLLWANARTPAIGFYRKNGWETVGEEFVIPTAGPHFKIVRHLQNL